MKQLLFSLLFFVVLPGIGLGQTAADTLAVTKQVDSLITVSRGLTDKKDFEKALEVNGVAEKLALEKFGRETALFGQCCFNKGRILFFKGAFPESEKWYLQAKAIQEKVLGNVHADYSKSINGLALLYGQMGDLEKAEPLFLENIAIIEKSVGNQDPAYAQAINNLAVLYKRGGYYEKSELLLIKANTIREKTLGNEDPKYAESLGNLATLYAEMGNYEKAIQLYLETINITKKSVTISHAFALNNLADAYRESGDYKKSEQYFLEAKPIYETVFSQDHPNYALFLNNMAALYVRMGNYEKAEMLLINVLAIQEKNTTKRNPNYARSLNDLAVLFEKMGNFEKAEQLYREAIDIWKQTLGKDHSRYATGLGNLANLYLFNNRPDQALPLFDTTANIQQYLIIRGLHHLSERELNNYLRMFSKKQYSVFSLAQNFPAATSTAYNNTLFHKGFLLNAYTQVKLLALRDSVATENFNLLKSYERLLAAQYAKPIDKRKDVEELEEKANNLEKELARSVAGYGEAMQQVKWQEVQQNLKPNEAAIEFVHYEFYHKNLTDSVMYAALVLRPGWEQPRMVGLFEQREVQPLLAAANTAATAGQLYATRGGLRGHKTRTRQEEGIVIPNPKTASLYQLIWAPLDSLLRDVSTVYFAPSGLLHRLDLAAIAVPGTDQILADKYSLVQLGSTRQLVVHGQPTISAQTAALFGGLKYDLEKPTESSDSVDQTKPSYDVAALRSALGSRGGDTWNYLPGTEKEVKNAAKTLGKAGYSVRTLSGSDGSEAAFKMMGKTGNPAPRVLHIATHGFFFPDPKDTTQQRGAFSDREPVFKTSDNPLLRSGLVLAGANPAWAGTKTPEGQEDGILTAYEISQMNLSGTELVVLSACETGLGDVEDNEGVYGLKRSFKIAGAKYLIMSLWQVPDHQTQELMSAFYKNWLERKMPIPKAFAAAQKTMRKRYDDPFFWAGFVLVE